MVRRVPEEYATIQEAVDSSVAGDVVLLSSGVYRGVGNRDIEFRGIDVVVVSSAGPEETIIDCERAGRGFYLHENETPAARIEGLTIRNGLAPDAGGHCGGGIYCMPSSPTITGCVIVDNEASLRGGGLFLGVFWTGLVERCVISGNRGEFGGGLDFVAGHGEIIECIITGNWASSGGAVLFDGAAANRLVGCTIAGNRAAYGGGVRSYNPCYLERCIVWGNCATIHGDEVYDFEAEFACCAVDSAGVYSVGDGATYDENCVFADPLFCDPAACTQTTGGEWTLDGASPCLAEHSPCGEQIGALGWGCGSGQPAGACCLQDGTCVVLGQEGCEDLGGAYLGDGTTCEASSCPPTPGKVVTWGQIKAHFREASR